MLCMCNVSWSVVSNINLQSLLKDLIFLILILIAYLKYVQYFQISVPPETGDFEFCKMFGASFLHSYILCCNTTLVF